jgi:hypothetical protein
MAGAGTAEPAETEVVLFCQHMHPDLTPIGQQQCTVVLEHSVAFANGFSEEQKELWFLWTGWRGSVRDYSSRFRSTVRPLESAGLGPWVCPLH